MWDFSGDEEAFFFMALVLSFILVIRWYLALARVPTYGRGGGRPRLALAAAPFLALWGLYGVLQTWADPVYVIGHLNYVALFMLGGVVWMMVVAQFAAPLLGVNLIDDAMERRNSAAVVTLLAAMFATSIVYTFCNIGNGPTIWTTLVPALIATVVLLALWGMLELFTATADAITIDRDLATAVRLGGMMIACALILGRAMAGDFHDWRETFIDFAKLGWPAIVITVLAIPISWATRPTSRLPRRSVLRAGIAPALVYVFLASVDLLVLGPPYVAPAAAAAGAHGGALR